MNLWHDIPLGKHAPETFNAIIEIPRGSNNKYEVDKETGLIKLDRVLHTAQFYPFDYGFVPQTYWHDNDPLDVMVLTTNPLVPGLLVEVRAVGVMRMIDCGESDDKLLAVPAEDPRFNNFKDIDDVDEHVKKEMKHFFETLKLLQNKTIEVKGFENAAAARTTVEEGIKLYKDKFSK
ncbi:MAG: inorganic pyrophosphatase [Candidatus Kerfeldbacteria bacterium RIFCSPHIGHO2_12_FULL_48_17]|uniref:Inorganic pyrophosphatase n=1 Tax=Candidatus Kerfeldbacteria bacterium RIFCSPHIGHO2_12_FULL_48_17 TaxID=1798542 RepID=A0A1G2B4X0_9BACT|nr:MAG: inorganic pyrophosphatase [Candidatus Kerfeldbacteria bacterium RIFCSPHIGHO2_12_FULL_48_17]